MPAKDTKPNRTRWTLEVDVEPSSGQLPRLYASAEAADTFSVRLYHCPTCPEQELRLTWDDLRKRHAGFCKQCRKLWPLPRRVLTAEELRAIADQRELDLT